MIGVTIVRPMPYRGKATSSTESQYADKLILGQGLFTKKLVLDLPQVSNTSVNTTHIGSKPSFPRANFGVSLKVG